MGQADGRIPGMARLAKSVAFSPSRSPYDGPYRRSARAMWLEFFKGSTVAGLESNRQNNTLLSILLLEQMQAFPHIFVHLTVVRFSILTEKLNRWAVRAMPECSIMTRAHTVQLRVGGLVSSLPDAAQPDCADWQL